MSRSLLYLIKIRVFFQCSLSCIIFLYKLFVPIEIYSQYNLVNNPSFEDLYNCNGPYYISKCKYWNPIDSSTIQPLAGGVHVSSCAGIVPNNGIGFQFPKNGQNYLRAELYCTNPCSIYFSRTYSKNRLKSTLVNGTTYCVKMYVSLEEPSPYAIDALQILLADASVDTIKYGAMPLTYLTPQITNTLGVIGDTLNWVEIKGTFTANGTEKYLILGNFKSDLSTAATASATGASTGMWSEYWVDDVSVIDFNLAANAGPDKNITLGDSAFIGIPPEVGLECVWASGTTTIGSGGGLWVKPTSVGTFSYVVTQNICGNIKKDTVNVNVSPGSVSENEIFAQSISFYPQPAQEYLSIYFHSYYDANINCIIQDINGKEVLRRELAVNQFESQLDLSGLGNGVYFIYFKAPNQRIAMKRLVIAE